MPCRANVVFYPQTCMPKVYLVSGVIAAHSAPISSILTFPLGEDALANLSIESHNNTISGHIRIRSKTQGIALSLGDKITLGG